MQEILNSSRKTFLLPFIWTKIVIFNIYDQSDKSKVICNLILSIGPSTGSNSCIEETHNCGGLLCPSNMCSWCLVKRMTRTEMLHSVTQYLHLLKKNIQDYSSIYKLVGVAPLVTNSPQDNYTTRQNVSIFKPPFYIAVNSLKVNGFINQTIQAQQQTNLQRYIRKIIIYLGQETSRMLKQNSPLHQTDYTQLTNTEKKVFI